MTSLNIFEEKSLTSEDSAKGKIFIYNNIIYSLYSVFNQTIKIYNNQSDSSYTIYSGKNVEIYDSLIQGDRLWICGRNIDSNIGVYGYSDYSNGQFQTISGWTEPEASEYILRIFVIDNVLHYIQLSSSGGQYEIQMIWGSSNHLIYSDSYCTFKDLYYDGNDLYLIVETIDPTNQQLYLKIFKQPDYSPTIGMNDISIVNLDDVSKNVIFFDIKLILGDLYLIGGKTPFINSNTNTVVTNEAFLYKLSTNTITSNFTFPNVYFQTISYLYLNGRNVFVGYLYQNIFDTLKYFLILLDSNANVFNNTIYIKDSNYDYISNDRKLEYIISDKYYYLLIEKKDSLNQLDTHLVQSKIDFKIYPNASGGSDPHIYPLYSKKFDMLRASTSKWYSFLKMKDFDMKVKFVGLKAGVFFHKVMIKNGGKNIDIDFNKKKIKGDILDHQLQKGSLEIKYNNLVVDKKFANRLDSKKMDIVQFHNLEYPLSLYIDMNLRYVHFRFEDKIPSQEQCSGIIV
jgi:hypothetical protein